MPSVDSNSSDKPSLLPMPGIDGGAKKLIAACSLSANFRRNAAVIALIDRFLLLRCDHSSSPITPKATFSPLPPNIE